MERKDTHKDKELNKLTELINNLKIKQGEINTEITEAEWLINNFTQKNDVNTIDNRNKRTIIFEYRDFHLGDKLRIKNPKGQQQNKGIIIGITNTRFTRIQTNNGNIVRRVQNNMINTT